MICLSKNRGQTRLPEGHDPKNSVLFRRAKRSWFVIDKKGIIRYAKTTGPGETDKNDEVLQVLNELK